MFPNRARLDGASSCDDVAGVSSYAPALSLVMMWPVFPLVLFSLIMSVAGVSSREKSDDVASASSCDKGC